MCLCVRVCARMCQCSLRFAAHTIVVRIGEFIGVLRDTVKHACQKNLRRPTHIHTHTHKPTRRHTRHSKLQSDRSSERHTASFSSFPTFCVYIVHRTVSDYVPTPDANIYIRSIVYRIVSVCVCVCVYMINAWLFVSVGVINPGGKYLS